MEDLLIRRELIIYDSEQTSQEGVFQEAYEYLLGRGYVSESYLDALTKREKEHPTALQLENINIAIPHVDSVHVKKGGILAMRLKKPVTFQNMLDKSDVDVTHIFFLILTSGETHLEALSGLMTMLQQKEIIDKIKEAKTQEELYQVLAS